MRCKLWQLMRWFNVESVSSGQLSSSSTVSVSVAHRLPLSMPIPSSVISSQWERLYTHHSAFLRYINNKQLISKQHVLQKHYSCEHYSETAKLLTTLKRQVSIWSTAETKKSGYFFQGVTFLPRKFKWHLYCSIRPKVNITTYQWTWLVQEKGNQLYTRKISLYCFS